MKNIFLIVAALIVAAVLLTRTCTPERVRIVEKVTTSIPDTVYLKPDTVVVEKVITQIKTVTKTREVPKLAELKDTNIYEYQTVSYFGDTIAVLDTILVADNQIVDHKQRVVLMDALTVREVKIEVPIVIRDTVTITKEITKTISSANKMNLYAGAGYLNQDSNISIVPSLGFSVNRHYIDAGLVSSLNNGFNGMIFSYKYRLFK